MVCTSHSVYASHRIQLQSYPYLVYIFFTMDQHVMLMQYPMPQTRLTPNLSASQILSEIGWKERHGKSSVAAINPHNKHGSSLFRTAGIRGVKLIVNSARSIYFVEATCVFTWTIALNRFRERPYFIADPTHNKQQSEFNDKRHP